MSESKPFELTLDEVRVLCELLPALILPPGFAVDPFDTGDSDSTVSARRAAALGSLREREVVTVGEDVELDALVVAPALRIALSLHAIAEGAFRAHAWTPADETRELISINRKSCASLRRVRARVAEPNDPSEHLIVSLFDARWLADHLLELVSCDAADERRGLESTEIGIADSRAIIDALRRRDTDVVASLAGVMDAQPAVELLDELTGSMESGFRLELFDSDARCVHAGDWFRGRTSWLAVNLFPGTQRVSAHSLAENGRVRITRVSRVFMRADLVDLVAGLVGERYAA